MNSIRLHNIDTPASLRRGSACAPLFPAYLNTQLEAVTFLLRNEDETGMT
jgi:hypothetical protein